MNRPLLPVLGAVLLCAHSLSAVAADSSTATTTNASQVRAQIEAKRDQLSGVASTAKTTAPAPATVLDAPVATDDAPAQDQQP